MLLMLHTLNNLEAAGHAESMTPNIEAETTPRLLLLTSGFVSKAVNVRKLHPQLTTESFIGDYGIHE